MKSIIPHLPESVQGVWLPQIAIFQIPHIIDEVEGLEYAGLVLEETTAYITDTI